MLRSFGAALLVSSLLVAASGCGDDDPAGTGARGAGASASGPGSGAAGAGAGAGAGGGAAGGGAASGGAASGSGGAPSTMPDPAFIPSATGRCPNFVSDGAGPTTMSFAPDGKARDVEIWISDAATAMDGPLVFYWHGTGSSPVVEPPYGLGSANVQAILAEGGIIAAAHHDPAAGQFPWFLTGGNGVEDDLRVADEVLACAIDKVGVDLRRIHSIGMSAGGLNTTQMSWRRSGYLASVVTYSGGELFKPTVQDPDNHFAAMIFHGGPEDEVFIKFQPISEKYQQTLTADGHFAFVCDHGMKHTIPTAAVDSVHQFFVDHPFGTSPDPYQGGLPPGFPAYCTLP
ncbi:MAG: hypothetical protein WKG00_26105 [Polyangiaceae bacterium]